MNKTLLTFLTVCTIIVSTYGSGKPVQTAAASDELIIEIPYASDKNHLLITQAFAGYPGIVYGGKCVESNLYFFTVDRSLQPDNNFVELSLKPLSLEYHIKTGTSVAKAMAACATMIEVPVSGSPLESK